MTFTVTKYLITEEKTADLSDKVCLSENCKLLNKQYKKKKPAVFSSVEDAFHKLFQFRISEIA